MIKKTITFLVLHFALLTYAQPGSLDTTFNLGIVANSTVNSICIQPDGKIIIGGTFTSYMKTSRVRIARLNADGTLDDSFNPGTGADNVVNAIEMLPDGKIIIAGNFTSYDGVPINRIARINENGSLDTTFDIGTGANDNIRAMVVQPDGKIIIGGDFTSYNDLSKNYIAKLNADGTPDADFNIGGTGANKKIFNLTLQSNRKIIIGGNFTSYNDTARSRIAVLNADGSLDAGFDIGTGANGTVYCSAVQPDGKIIIAGAFANYNGRSRVRIARLNANGTLDGDFTTGEGADGFVRTLKVLSNGKIIIGGDFLNYNGTARNRIACLNSNGDLDTTFKLGQGASASVYATAVQSDGKIFIGGRFISYAGTTQSRIAKLKGFVPLPVASAQTFNSGAKVADLMATGVNLKWYATSASAIVLTSNIILTDNTYYVTQTLDDTESERVPVTVTIISLPAIKISGDSTVCPGTTGVVTFSGTPNATVTYTVNGGENQTILLNAEGIATLTTPVLTDTAVYNLVSVTTKGIAFQNQSVAGTLVISVNIPNAPLATSQVVNIGSTVSSLVADGSDLRWYTSANGVSSLSNDQVLANGTYYVSQIEKGCESERTAVEVTLGVVLCSGSTIEDITAVSGDNINWYKTLKEKIPLEVSTLLHNQTYYYTTGVETIKIPLSVQITPATATGSITGAGGTICYNTEKILALSASFKGRVEWQSSLSKDDGTFAKIDGETESVLNTGKLAETTYFKAVVTNGVCPPKPTAAVKVSVYPQAEAGIITGNDVAVCPGKNTSKLILNDYTGKVQWQYSTDDQNFADVTTLGKSASYTVRDLGRPFYYRTVVTSGTGCNPAISESVHINVKPVAKAGTISGQNTISIGEATVLTLSDYEEEGTTLLWKYSQNNLAYYNGLNDVRNDNVYPTGELSSDMYYKAVLTKDGCTSETEPFLVSVNSLTLKTNEPITDILNFGAKALPNPFKDTFTVHLNTVSQESVRISVYDMLGKLIEQKVTDPSELIKQNIGENYSSGIYNVIINQASETKILRVIKR